MGVGYDEDIVAWATQQAALLRAGQFQQLDSQHIAEELEIMGKSEKRELASRLTVLLTHLLKWQFQPVRRGASWQRTIRVQRKELNYDLQDTPSLKALLQNSEWLQLVWDKAVLAAMNETGLDRFPENWIWTTEQVLSEEFYPDH